MIQAESIMSSKEGIEKKTSAKEGGKWRSFSGPMKIFLYSYGVIMVLWHIWAIVINPVDPWIVRSTHLSFAIVLTFLLIPGSSKSKHKVSVIDWLLIVASASVAVYVALTLDQLLYRISINPTNTDIFMGILQITVIIEAARRHAGIILPLLAIFFLAYAIYGHNLPGILGFPRFDFRTVIGLIFTEQGIYGAAVYASASLGMFFITFGAFLKLSGAGNYFIKLSSAIAGGTRGGPAKVAIVGSGLFGMISGSSAANVATTGSVTIPLMKATGYRPHFAAAVEAAASQGGQLMPPLMGTAAFIMAQMIGVPYREIMIANLMPAVLNYTAVFIMVDFEAVRENLVGLKRSELPRLIQTLKEGIPYLLPIALLLYLLVVLRLSPVMSVLLSMASLVVLSWFTRQNKMGLNRIVEAMYEGSKGVLLMGVACGTAGIVIGVLTATGLGLRFASIILGLSGESIFLVLLLSAILSIILGMGMPVAPAYIIASAVAAPAMIKMDVPVLVAHLFVFYWATNSTLTPPVCLAVYTAASIAIANVWRSAVTSLQLSLITFVIPFIFVFEHELLMMGSLFNIILVNLVTILAMISLTACIRYPRITIPKRLLFAAAGIIMIFPIKMIETRYLMDVIGITLFAVTIGVYYVINKKKAVIYDT